MNLFQGKLSIDNSLFYCLLSTEKRTEEIILYYKILSWLNILLCNTSRGCFFALWFHVSSRPSQQCVIIANELIYAYLKKRKQISQEPCEVKKQ